MALSHHINTLRAKPEPVRERIALMTSAGITGFVALIWVVTLAASGTFSLAPATAGTLTDATAGQADVQNGIAQSQTNFSQLVGAVGAAVGATSSAPALRIIDDGSSSSFDSKSAASANNSNATVIPF